MRATLERTQDCDGDRVRSARDGGVGEAPQQDVPGRRARALLRPPDARRSRRGRSTSAAAGCTTTSRTSLVVNWQAPAARPFYTATPADPQRVTQRRRYRTDGPPHRRHLRRVARRHRGRGRIGVGLPARGARAPARGPDARHRRDDPVRPVPADHGRARRRARRPGRAGHRQDRGRAAPRVVAALHAPRAAAPRARRRPEPDVHGLRRRTCCPRSARRRSSSAPSPSCSTGSRSSARRRPTSRG